MYKLFVKILLALKIIRPVKRADVPGWELLPYEFKMDWFIGLERQSPITDSSLGDTAGVVVKRPVPVKEKTT